MEGAAQEDFNKHYPLESLFTQSFMARCVSLAETNGHDISSWVARATHIDPQPLQIV